LQEAAEDQYLQYLQQTLSQPAFYFSYTYDMTHTLHRMHVGGEGFYSQPLLTRADTQFVWNNHFLEPLLRFPECAGFTVPVMHGFIGFVSGLGCGWMGMGIWIDGVVPFEPTPFRAILFLIIYIY
jgi:hypothetical protein